MSVQLQQWMETTFNNGDRLYMKRLAGNDTLLTSAHQAGPYVPKRVTFDLFPSLLRSTDKNPRTTITSVVVSHNTRERDVTAIWYNNRIVAGGTRDECRITGWGGRDSPLLDPESTGSIVAICFKGPPEQDVEACEVWVCSSLDEEDLIEDRFGPVEPGSWSYSRQPSIDRILPTSSSTPLEVREKGKAFKALHEDISQLSLVLGRPVDTDCRLAENEIPVEWIESFPSGEAIIDKAVSLRPSYARLVPDSRLLKRRNCEYELFLSVEEVIVLPVARRGFSSVEAFITFANSVTNRRKTRSGRSLELHAKRIFDEEKVPSYSYDEISEGRKRPDFLFPSADAYHDQSFPEKKLRMLAAKTTCKDRWRQVADEAERIESKHLLTLQEGVSDSQFEQMRKAGIKLVVPKPLHNSYPKSLRHELMSFSEFIQEVRRLRR